LRKTLSPAALHDSTGGHVHWSGLMRGSDQRSGSLFSYVDLESRVRGDHQLRPIREIVNGALSALSADFKADLCGWRWSTFDPAGAAASGAA